MAISTIIKTKRDGTLTFSDNGGSNTFVVAYEAGDLSVDIPGPTVNVFLDRGEFGATPSLRYGDDQPMGASFTAHLRDFASGSFETLTSIVTRQVFDAGQDTTWVSTLGTSAEVDTLTLAWAVEGTDHGDESDHTLTMNHCVVNGSLSEGDPNTVSLTIVSYDLYPTLV